MKKEFITIKSKLKFLILGLICFTSNICGDPDNENEGKGRMTKILELPRNVRELEREINRAKRSIVTPKDLEKIPTKSEVDEALKNSLQYDSKTGSVQFEIGENSDKKTIKLPYKGSADTKINYSMLQDFLNKNDVELNEEVIFGTKSINDIIKNILINPETVYIIGDPAEPTQKMSIQDFVKKVLLDPTTEYGYETNKKATLAVLSNELLENTVKEMLDSMDPAMPITLNKDTMLFVPMGNNTFTKSAATADVSINLVDELVAIRNFADTCKELKDDKWVKEKVREIVRLRTLLVTFNWIEVEFIHVNTAKRTLFGDNITDNLIGRLNLETIVGTGINTKGGSNATVLDEIAGEDNFIQTNCVGKIFFRYRPTTNKLILHKITQKLDLTSIPPSSAKRVELSNLGKWYNDDDFSLAT